jgi:hypothetical protein
MTTSDPWGDPEARVPDPFAQFGSIGSINDAIDSFVRSLQALRFDVDSLLPDPREGEDTPIRTLRAGTRVFILGDVFTVSSVDMRAPIPTVWVREMPNAPLYFNRGDTIPLANESTE